MVAIIAFHDFTGGTATTLTLTFCDDTRNRQQISMKKTGSGTGGNLLTWRSGRNTNRALHRRNLKPALITAATKSGALLRHPQTKHSRNGISAEANCRHQGGVGELEIAALEQEQEHQHDQQLERLNAMMDIGRMLPVTTSHNEQQSQKPQPNALKHPGTGKETKPKRALRISGSGIERSTRSDETARHQERNRSAKPPFSATRLPGSDKPEPPTAAQDDRHLSSSGGSFTTNEMSPCADSQESDQATRPAPGQTPEQQAARLKEAVARFEAAGKERHVNAQRQQKNPRHKPDPQPPQEPVCQRPRERGIGR